MMNLKTNAQNLPFPITIATMALVMLNETEIDISKVIPVCWNDNSVTVQIPTREHRDSPQAKWELCDELNKLDDIVERHDLSRWDASRITHGVCYVTLFL